MHNVFAHPERGCGAPTAPPTLTEKHPNTAPPRPRPIRRSSPLRPYCPFRPSPNAFLAPIDTAHDSRNSPKPRHPRLRPSSIQSVLILLYRLIVRSVRTIIVTINRWRYYAIRLPATVRPINFKSIPIQLIFQLLQQGMKLMPCEVPPAIDE